MKQEKEESNVVVLNRETYQQAVTNTLEKLSVRQEKAPFELILAWTLFGAVLWDELKNSKETSTSS